MRRKSTINQEDSLLEDSQLKIFLSKESITPINSRSMSIIQPKLQFDNINISNQNTQRKKKVQRLNADKIKVLPFKRSAFDDANKFRSFSATKMYFSRPKNIASPLNAYKRLSRLNLRPNQQKSNPEQSWNKLNVVKEFKSRMQQSRMQMLNKNSKNTLKIQSVLKQKLNTGQKNQKGGYKPSKIGNQQKLKQQLKSACGLDRRVNQVIHNIILTNQFKKSWHVKPSFVYRNKNSVDLRLNSSKRSLNESRNSNSYQNNQRKNRRHSIQRPHSQLLKRQKLSRFTMRPKSVWQKEQQLKKKYVLENPFRETIGQSENFNEKETLIDLI